MSSFLRVAAFLLWLPIILADAGAVEYSIQLDVISSGFDKKTCWVHPRAGILPAGTPSAPESHPAVVLTMNKLRLTGSDVYYAINHLQTNDLGKTWSDPKPNKVLGRQYRPNGTCRSVCDYWPKWHAASGKLLGIGHSVWYTKQNKVMKPRPRTSPYSVYDPVSSTWSKPKFLRMPNLPKFENAGAGSSQRYDLPNGEILLPIYFRAINPNESKKTAKDYNCTIVRARFNGETLTYLTHGDELTVKGGRGFSESSITQFKDRYFYTLRNNEAGYVTSGTDGLHFDKPKKWTFDDGADLGNYNTQQHWVTHSDALHLVYTRRGADNDHVFRHRAPLFMAEVDPERLCVIRTTERILVPEHGARLGNFGVTDVSPDETWVTTAEWMQTKAPRNRDYTIPMKYGSDNRVFAARIVWDKPNELVKRQQDVAGKRR